MGRKLMRSYIIKKIIWKNSIIIKNCWYKEENNFILIINEIMRDIWKVFYLIRKIINNIVKTFLILLIFLVPIYLVIGKYSMESNLKKTEEIWNTIVWKIELYKIEKWYYPKELTDLMPKYFNVIPKGTSGNWKFFYYTKENHTYVLYSNFWLTWSYLYHSDKKKWSKF